MQNAIELPSPIKIRFPGETDGAWRSMPTIWWAERAKATPPIDPIEVMVVVPPEGCRSFVCTTQVVDESDVPLDLGEMNYPNRCVLRNVGRCPVIFRLDGEDSTAVNPGGVIYLELEGKKPSVTAKGDGGLVHYVISEP